MERNIHKLNMVVKSGVTVVDIFSKYQGNKKKQDISQAIEDEENKFIKLEELEE